MVYIIIIIIIINLFTQEHLSLTCYLLLKISLQIKISTNKNLLHFSSFQLILFVLCRCVLCLANARDWRGVLRALSGQPFPSSYLPLLSMLRPLLAAAHLLDTQGPPPPPPAPPAHLHSHAPLEPPFVHLWEAMVAVFDAAHKKGNNCSTGSSSTNNGSNSRQTDVLSLPEFLELVYCLKEPACLSLLTSLLAVLYNKRLGEPSAELHSQYPQLWVTMTVSKDGYLSLVKETLASVVAHAIKFFPGADHVREEGSNCGN